MFEEICLVCGKHILQDGQAYCSDECRHADSSPYSSSVASSALSSPHVNYAVGGEVPALLPSALGTALNGHGRNRYSVSSSASSASWAISTEEDEDEYSPEFASHEYASQPDSDSAPYDIGSKSPSSSAMLYPPPSTVLSYARRPSGTNNHSTVPLLRRTSSSSSSSRHRHLDQPRSAPLLPSLHSSQDESSSQSSSRVDSELDKPRDSTITAKKSKRSRNRASLPAYFSLLRMGATTSSNTESITSASNSHAISPTSSSSIYTITRPSPPTPKLTLANGLPHRSFAVPIGTPAAPMLSSAIARGRRREAGTSSSSRRSEESPSPSRSQSRGRRHELRRNDSASSDDQGLSSSHIPPRGRAAIRRNSSPLAKMQNSPHDNVYGVRGSRSGTRTERRGRAHNEDLQGLGFTTFAPGYGHGRSGLMNRERGVGAHGLRY